MSWIPARPLKSGLAPEILMAPPTANVVTNAALFPASNSPVVNADRDFLRERYVQRVRDPTIID
jgi:hypothetical protein